MAGAVEHADELLQIRWQLGLRGVIVGGCLGQCLGGSHHGFHQWRWGDGEHAALLGLRQPVGDRGCCGGVDRLVFQCLLFGRAPRLRAGVGVVVERRRLHKTHRQTAGHIPAAGIGAAGLPPGEQFFDPVEAAAARRCQCRDATFNAGTERPHEPEALVVCHDLRGACQEDQLHAWRQVGERRWATRGGRCPGQVGGIDDLDRSLSRWRRQRWRRRRWCRRRWCRRRWRRRRWRRRRWRRRGSAPEQADREHQRYEAACDTHPDHAQPRGPFCSSDGCQLAGRRCRGCAGRCRGDRQAWLARRG